MEQCRVESLRLRFGQRSANAKHGTSGLPAASNQRDKGMVMAHHARLPALSRPGRMSLPLLLSIVSICVLVSLVGWQVGIRFAIRSPSENSVLPDEPDGGRANTSQPISQEADDTNDDGAFLRDNFE